MIETKITITPVRVELSVVGHAGYNEYGKDIVCAAVSSVTQAVIYRLQSLYPENVTLDYDNGKIEFEIQIPESISAYDLVIELFTMLANHINRIASEYPDNVAKVKKNYIFE